MCDCIDCKPLQHVAPVVPDVLDEPILWSHCPVCGIRHEGSMHAAYYGDTEDVLFNETCDHCYQWFRLAEFDACVKAGNAWASAEVHRA